jgi:hypothetical protein
MVTKLMLGVLIMSSSQIGAKADEYCSYAFGKGYTTQVTEEVVRRAPQWLEASENPPVAARRALRTAGEKRDRSDIGDIGNYGICPSSLYRTCPEWH